MTGASEEPPLSILWLNQLDPAHPWAGGAERHIAEVGERLSRLGHRITLVSERRPGLPREERVGAIHVVRGARRGLLHAWAIANGRRLVERFEVDVVVGDLSKIVPWGRRSFAGRPMVSVVRHVSGRTIFGEAPFPAPPLLWAIERATPVFLADDRILTEANATARVLRRLGARRDRISRVVPGVDAAQFSPSPGRRSAEPLVMYVGRLRRYKRVDLALRAFARLLGEYPCARFEIAGSGTDHDRLVAESQRLGLSDRVTFHGTLSSDALVDLYRRAWVHVQPSAVEGWGYTAMEAMACGTPVAAFATASLPEVLGPLGAPFLAPNGDVEALAGAMGRALDRIAAPDTALTEGLASYARSYSWETTALRYAELLGTTVREARAGAPLPLPRPVVRPRPRPAASAPDHAGIG